MARNDPQINLRLPPDLKDRLEAEADANHRAFKAEVVARLEQSLGLAKLINDYRLAEERLADQERLERELRRQIEILKEQITLLKTGEAEKDLNSPAVQKAMIKIVQEVMGSVVQYMREEHRIANGVPLLLRWFDLNPEERAEYDALSDDEQDQFVREKSHDLWIAHLKQKRPARPNKEPTVKLPRAEPAQVTEPKPNRTQSGRIANNDPAPGTRRGVRRFTPAQMKQPKDEGR